MAMRFQHAELVGHQSGGDSSRRQTRQILEALQWETTREPAGMKSSRIPASFCAATSTSYVLFPAPLSKPISTSNATLGPVGPLPVTVDALTSIRPCDDSRICALPATTAGPHLTG